MDKFDRQILNMLTANARVSVTSIGEAIGLSRSAVNERIKRLENSGDIVRYTIERGQSDSQGEPICCYFELTFRPFDLAAVKAQLLELPGITQAHALSGSTDILIYAQGRSMAELNQLREQLSTLPQLEKLVTSTAIEQLI